MSTKHQWIIGLGLALTLLLGFGYEYCSRNQHLPAVLTLSAGTMVPRPKPLPHFQLKDSEGHHFSNVHLQNAWHLVFFGYAHCPDVCPAMVDFVSGIWEKLPKRLKEPEQIKFLFFSLDPERDSPYDLKNFLHRYDPRFLGITGDRKEVDKLVDQLGIHAVSSNPGVITHSGALLLLNRQGRLQATFSPPFKAEDLIQDLLLLIH